MLRKGMACLNLEQGRASSLRLCCVNLQDPKYYHFPGSRKKLQIFHHHAIDWRLYHPEHASKHYYGQVSFSVNQHKATSGIDALPFLHN